MKTLQLNENTVLGVGYNKVDQKIEIRRVQNCQTIVDELAELRAHDGENTKAPMRLFAKIPNEIVYQLKAKGIDIFRMAKDPSMRRRFLREIQYNYPDLKATNKIHLG